VGPSPKPPLELDIVDPDRVAFHMIVAHLKSKQRMGPKTPQDALRIGIANRRNNLAQAVWLRRGIDAQAGRGTPLMVLAI